MPKYIDDAFGTALARSSDRDLAGRNLAPAHTKLHQLPIDEDRCSGPAEFQQPVVVKRTDADRMDVLRGYGFREGLLCSLSKTPGTLAAVEEWVEGLLWSHSPEQIRAFMIKIAYVDALDTFVYPNPRSMRLVGTVLDCHRRAAEAAGVEGFVIHDHGTRPGFDIPASEHSLMAINDLPEDGVSVSSKITAQEAYETLLLSARKDSAEKNVERLRARYRG